MHTPVGPKPAHQLPDHNPPMSQKEHIKKKRAEERKQQELEEMHVSISYYHISPLQKKTTGFSLHRIHF